MAAANGSRDGSSTVPQQADVVVVGAGFSGLYLLHRLRQAGFHTVVFDSAGDVGGTWYWNRYPGARCDIPTTDYTYSFDSELERDWTWSEKYATQSEILAYLGFVADRFDLRKDIYFDTRLDSAVWDDKVKRWRVRTDRDDEVECRWFVMAAGCLSLPKTPDIEGASRFRGDVYFTGRWPHDKVDFTGKKVAVIGTGSSGIQSIPLIAGEASQLTVFQRTPNFSIPAHNGPASAERLAAIAEDRASYRDEARRSRGGIPTELTEIMGTTASEEVRRQRFEAAWEMGELFGILGVFADQGFNVASNDIVAEKIREKIRGAVDDPETAEVLSPRDHPFGTKRPCLDTNYYQTFNLPHVRLVNLRKTPIATITETGIDTADESFEFDAIVYATGFDAMTGPLVSVDITGRDGVTLREKWADGPSTYLGLTTVGFPNFFTVTGPQSPSVLSNMAVSIEQHVEWISDCLVHLRENRFDSIEPTSTAEAGWMQHCDDCASITLYPMANSWYMGANVPGKPRVFLPYIGGVDNYRGACEDVVADGYLGFELAGPGGQQCQDGVVRRVQPDVAMVLQMMTDLGLPPIESLPVPDARVFMDTMAAARPPGPAVGEMVDGTLPGGQGQLEYRLYRPPTAGPHPVVAYFHGGGWVLGNKESDEPLCRDLCVRSDAIVVSVDYRHAPETRFRGAVEDAFAAVQWIAANAGALGGVPGQVAVAGWSAGANLATVVCQQARDAGGPMISAQLLLTPVTDCNLDNGSYRENADGYILTAALMRWFWDHYADPADRDDWRATPIHGQLGGLPPAVIVTADFDPLRDEGDAYAAALDAAGVPVTHVRARGHTHTSLTMVDVVISGARVREDVAAAFRTYLSRAAAVPTG
jgi:cation diffusion facilitator CzcD-associated flavoprotein CzcO/acetyl esterase/lipase